MKEKFKIFKNEKIVINVRSQKQYDEFMKMCEKQGLKWWGTGYLPTKQNIYNNYKENTCIDLNNLKCLYYSGINYFKNAGYKIITYKDFIKEESIQFTKSDLKDNHIVKNRGNQKFMWGNRLTDNYNSELANRDYNILDIMEVWEFDKLVWKREESILDEVEIIEEDKPIESIDSEYFYTNDMRHNELIYEIALNRELIIELKKLEEGK